MTNLEIVTADDDIASMTIFWTSDGEAFISQVDRDGFKQSILLHVLEAKQTIAALTAFVEGKHSHMSDCALHSSPAYPIEPCTCRTPPVSRPNLSTPETK